MLAPVPACIRPWRLRAWREFQAPEAFNWMLLAFAISQFLELQLIPHMSMTGIYVFFIATYAVTLPLFV